MFLSFDIRHLCWNQPGIKLHDPMLRSEICVCRRLVPLTNITSKLRKDRVENKI